MFKYTQRTFNGGVLDRELMGRQDLSKYFCGASLLKNFLVRRQGNLAKRRGTDFTANLNNLLGHRTLDDGSTVYDTVTKSRLIPLVQEREQGYYAMLCGKRAFLVDRNRGIYHTDGTWRRFVDDYLFVPNVMSQHIVGDYVCRIGDVPYATLKDAVESMSDGDTVILVADAKIDATMSVKGKIDVCGHVIKVTSETAVLNFGQTSGVQYGIVNSSLTEGSIVWDDNLDVTGNIVFIVHAAPGNLVLSGVRLIYPFTGGEAFVFESKTPQGCVEISGCTIRSKCRIGDVDGRDANEASNIVISNSTISSSYTNSGTTKCAFTHDSSYSDNRKIRFLGSDIIVPSCAIATYGFRLDGGKCRCRSFGYSNSSLGYNKVKSGLVSVSLASNQILEGSVADGTVVVEGVTYYKYIVRPAVVQSAARASAAPMVMSSGVTSANEEEVTPYFVEIPYEDGDLADVDYFQSGDTVFLAHKGYMPAKLVFDAVDKTLSYEVIEFNATTWLRPLITSADSTINIAKDSASSSSDGSYKTTVRYAYNAGTDDYTKTSSVSKWSSSTSSWVSYGSSTEHRPKRTVKYVVTYVKDGVESPPSNPIEVSYASPWEDGGKVTINFSKGANKDDPDYYNIYKKESTEYGLIGSTSKTGFVDAFPEMAGVKGLSAGYSTTPISMASFNGYGLKDVTDKDLLGSSETDVVTSSPSRVVGNLGTYDVYRGVGGVKFGTNCRARFLFGGNSGITIGKVDLCFDSHTLRYVEDSSTGKVKVYDDMRLTGKGIAVTITYTDKTGAQEDHTQTVHCKLDPVAYTPEGGSEQSAYTGFVSHYCGSLDPGSSFAAVSALVNRTVRSESFVFSNLSNGDKQVKSIVVSCYDDFNDETEQATGNIVSSYLCGVVFSNVGTTETSYDDDYITPDLTVTPPSDEVAFRGRGNYPSCVGLYQQRLIFAATSDQPFGFWMSAVGDLYNFTPHASIREDDPIEAELAATEFPNINHIVMSRDIIMLGDGGEWKIAPVTGNTITYKTISAGIQSSIGSAKWLKPLTVGKEVIFAERTGMTLRSIVYNFSSDGYESTDLSVLSGNLFADNRIERMCYKQHPDSTIECVLADGTVAALVYMPEHEVAAWSLCVLGGGYRAIDIASSKALNGNTTDVMLTVVKSGVTELWTVRPDLPEKTVDAQVCMDRVRRLTAAEAASGWVSGWTAVDRATGACVTSEAGLVAGHDYLCGFVFDAEVATVRPEPAGEGTIQFEIKNAKDVEVRCLDGASWKVAPYGLVDHTTYAQKHVYNPTAVAGVLTLDGADVRLVLTGKNGGDGRVHLKCTNPYPQSILSISVDYEIQPMSNQEG